jgi:hypothetical protein
MPKVRRVVLDKRHSKIAGSGEMTTRRERSLQARIAAHRLHAAGKTNTGPARRAFLARFEAEVDPDGRLTPQERAKRAEHARKAYFLALARKSAETRRKR